MLIWLSLPAVTAGWPVLFGTGLGDGNGAPANFGAVESLFGGFAFFFVLEFDKTKALAPAALAVTDHVSRGNGAMCGEQLAQLIVSCSERQATYK